MEEICGDIPLERPERTAYIRTAFRAWVKALQDKTNSSYHYRVTRPLVASELASSPLRIYTDRVFQDVLTKYCPSPGYILDAGCGTGNYALIIKNNGIEGIYVGADIRYHPNWLILQNPAKTGLTCRFVQVQAENIGIFRPVFNFCLTLHALEHIRGDRDFAQSLFQVLQPGSYGLHIAPAPASILQYGYHGWRRYSAIQLTNLFEQAGFDIVKLYSLGGLFSYLLHLVWISWLEVGILYQIFSFGYLPKMISRLRLSNIRKRYGFRYLYIILLKLALRLDKYALLPTQGYAVVIRKPGVAVTDEIRQDASEVGT